MKKQGVLVLLILGVTLLTIYNKIGTTRQETAKIGYQAPAFRLPSLDGPKYAFKPGGGKPAVLNFWASWCEPCKEEMPEFAKQYVNYYNEIDMIAINITGKDSLEAVKAFVQTNKISIPILLDKQTTAAQVYNIVQIPTTYFIDKNGIVTDRIVGPANAVSLQRKIRDLLQ